MTSLIGACFVAATILFVVSLPLGSTQVGTTLRRWAGAVFLAALAPSVAPAAAPPRARSAVDSKIETILSPAAESAFASPNVRFLR